MREKDSQPEKASSRKRLLFWLAALCLVVFIIGYSNLHRISKQQVHPQKTDSFSDPNTTGASQAMKLSLTRNEGEPREGPKGPYIYIYDKSPTDGRYLLSKSFHKDALPDSDAPAGRDLWVQDPDGKERLIAESVYRARFSPDGQKIAYATSDVVMKIEDLDGNKIAEVDRAYEPNWHPDSKSVVFTRVPDDRPLHNPEVLSISTFNLQTGETKRITDGTWDDVRPHYSPEGDWILFVSGGRTGLASFWQVPVNGGEPVQVTNTGLQEVNEKFIPTPYDRSMWSNDRRWFVYDFKSGDTHQIWGLNFDGKGNFQGAVNIGEGLDPQLSPDGHTLVAQRQNGDTPQTVRYTLP